MTHRADAVLDACPRRNGTRSPCRRRRRARRGASRSPPGRAARRRRTAPRAGSRAAPRSGSPVCSAPPIPRLNGSSTTTTPAARATAAVRVGRAVRDDEDVEIGPHAASSASVPRQRGLFVPRRHDDERARLGPAAVAARVRDRERLARCARSAERRHRKSVPVAPSEPVPRSSPGGLVSRVSRVRTKAVLADAQVSEPATAAAGRGRWR